MESKCFRRACNFVQEVAHMDEAVDVLRQHYRAVHPTKAFYESREVESLEAWNLTGDEVMEQHNLGSAENPNYDWRGLRNTVNRYNDDRYGRYTNDAAVAEVTRRVEEYEAANPPQAEAMHRVVEWAADVPVARAAVPIIPFDEAVLEVADDGGF